jgi:serine/threonine protein kinase
LNFHNTPKRYQDLCRAIDDDLHNRVDSARVEIDFAVARQKTACILTDAHANGELPERIVHNDTKINNVLFDASSRETLCVIDLDTVMPGLLAYDFGDLVRTMSSRSREDERDLNQVQMDLAIFEAITDGYLRSTRPFLCQQELLFMVPAAIVITYETGIRFLIDYLQGDCYFRIDRPMHNLDRCRNQFRLISSMEAQRNAMEAIVKRNMERSH